MSEKKQRVRYVLITSCAMSQMQRVELSLTPIIAGCSRRCHGDSSKINDSADSTLDGKRPQVAGGLSSRESSASIFVV